MKKEIRRLLLAGAVLLASNGAWAQAASNTEVRYDKPEQFMDVSFDQHKREEVLTELTRHFEKLGATLPAGQQLKIVVKDIDLAGRENPALRTANDIRVMTGGADWPRISLSYVLEQDGKVIGSADAQLSDMAYLTHMNRYASGERLRYEKRMIDEWFAKAFNIPLSRLNRSS
ncbi:DUF3016 domain-containing protein [Janthinobacterium psychrotolerans]|uniref:DUF3016 domain-containing protein n=1 Tax=Janthinobacterium psychrotolerans TaxID=1747903 RepID=A0A1A7BU21_9BURK|nr:DUF3016 domain-containing protein [Janthinobacterium psychrotolerans]OBV37007.1 Protein of unknown function (DUF3016) [Janthinobacterium psychrotolerans]